MILKTLDISTFDCDTGTYRKLAAHIDKLLSTGLNTEQIKRVLSGPGTGRNTDGCTLTARVFLVSDTAQ